jgi:hypothetical protein
MHAHGMPTPTSSLSYQPWATATLAAMSYQELVDRFPCLVAVDDAITKAAHSIPKGEGLHLPSIVADRAIAFIGWHAPRRHGKDAAAHIVQGLGGHRMSLIDPMKDLVQQATGCDRLWIDGEEDQRGTPRDLFQGLTGRQVTQLAGTALGRERHWPSIWTDLFAVRMGSFEKGSLVTCSDVRFPEEAQMVKASGTLIRVWKPDGPPVDASYKSEIPLPKGACHALLLNDGSLDDYANRIAPIIHMIRVDSRAFHNPDASWWNRVRPMGVHPDEPAPVP